MPRPRETGPRTFRKKLRDGSIWDYTYDRQTGKALGRQRVDGDAGEIRPGSIGELIRDYRASQAFELRKPGTKEIYNRILNNLNELYGDLPVRQMTPAAVQEIKDALQDTPAKANNVLRMLSIIYTFARRRNRVEFNPAASPGRLVVRARTEIWSAEDENRVLETFRPSLRLAFMLMLYTLQRVSDVLDMTLAQVVEQEGRLYITLRQQKTRELVGVPVHSRLDPFLRERLADLRPSLLLVPNAQGSRWLRRSFSKAWDTDLAKANKVLSADLLGQGMTAKQIVEELAGRHRHRHDLRRTGIVRLAEAGATTPQIAAVSGHQIDYCECILETYLPRRTETALAAIEAWERAGDTPRVVRLADRRGQRG